MEQFQQTSAIALKAHDDACFFVRKIIGAEPDPWQSSVLTAISSLDRIAAPTGHGVGKTALGAWLTCWWIFTRPGSKVVTTAPTWRQVSDLLWSEVHKWVRQAKLHEIGWVWPFKLLDTRLEIEQEWYATGESTDDPEKLEGYHAPYILYIIDEAKGVPDSHFDAMEGGMTTVEAKMALLSTPGDPKGKLYRVCTGQEPGWAIFPLSSIDSPRVTRKWIEERKLQWGEDSPMYKMRVLGQFADLADDSLIPVSQVDAAVELWKTGTPLGDKSEHICGLDVARYGSAKTVFCIREGNRVVDLIGIHNRDTMQVTGRLIALQASRKFKKAYVDAVGIGGAVVDRAKELRKHWVEPINAGEASSDPTKFANLRAEMYWNLRDLFAAGDIAIPDDPYLTGQLTAIKYKYNSKGQLLIESKEDMRRRRMPSPDEADALAMAYRPHVPEGIGVWL